ncbi:hypothetical protein FQR65_LT01107 [Abscondita terminalis]|nr:hypothetical protein FQR65_LT01107 [Abscondita terminalis]
MSLRVISAATFTTLVLTSRESESWHLCADNHRLKEVTEDSQYVKLDLENGKTAVIKKSTYCWLLEEERGSVSSFRRFIGYSKNQSKTRSKQFKRNTIQNEKASKKRKIGRYSGHATTSDEEDDMDTSLDNSTASKIDRQDMAIDEDGYQNNAIKLHYITGNNPISDIIKMALSSIDKFVIADKTDVSKNEVLHSPRVHNFNWQKNPNPMVSFPHLSSTGRFKNLPGFLTDPM